MRMQAAEAIGAFALVFAGAGAVMTEALTGSLGTLGIAITFGLVITVMVYAVGHVSGAHFNPAVTLAFATTGRFPWRRVPGYLLAQALGATAAAFLLVALLGRVGNVGATIPSEHVGAAGLLAVEALITALLMFVIAAVATDARAVGSMAGVAIGATVALAALFAGPLTGAGMNPARSLGPALAAGPEALAWMPAYVVAPIAGALVGAFAYEAVRGRPAPDGLKDSRPGLPAGPASRPEASP